MKRERITRTRANTLDCETALRDIPMLQRRSERAASVLGPHIKDLGHLLDREVSLLPPGVG